MNRFAARQSIVDRHQNVFAYELLFRNSLINSFPNIDPVKATTQLIEATRRRHSLAALTQHKPAFINFTLATLKQQFPQRFTNREIVVEILESEKPSSELLAICKKLHKLGYPIALDDYIHHQDWHDFFPFIEFIKVDLQQSSPSDIGLLFDHLKAYPHIKLLAEKIETKQQYHFAQQVGFDFFQGYFFDRPQIIQACENEMHYLDSPLARPKIIFG